MTDRVYFMSKGGDGLEDPPSQVHLPDGSMLKPFRSTFVAGVTLSMFAVPAKWRNAMTAMGFELTSDASINRVPQGPTSARPSTPAANDGFYDTTLSRLVFWNGSAWVPA